MTSIKNNVFKLVNVFMVVSCLCAAWMNHVGVNIINPGTATSSINGDTFEYTTSDNSFLFKKNGELIGFLPTDQKIKFVKDNHALKFNGNAIGVGIAAMAGQAVVGAGATIGGGALAGGAAMLELPGAAAVQATLGGAGVAAAEAAAAAGSMTVGATIAAVAAPVAIGLAIGALGA